MDDVVFDPILGEWRSQDKEKIIERTIEIRGGGGSSDSGGGGGGVASVVAGNNIDVDNTDPANPVIAVENLTLADVSDITASATEVNYTDGVTSAIQTQLNGKSSTSHTHALAAGATDVTASAAEVNILDGATLSTTELNYVDGVTSNIQTQLDSKLESQTYSVFVYNSSGSQSGNRYNDFADLMDAVALQEGPKTIVIEQDETIPSTGMPTAGWNFDYITWYGNGKSYDAGGYTLTFPTGVKISSWTFGVISSLRFYSTSTSAIWTTAGGFTLLFDIQGQLWSTTAEFILNTGGGQCVLSMGRAARIKDGGYEVFATTASAYACIVVVTRGDNATIDNETIRSTNGIIFLDLVQSAIQDLYTGGFPSSHSNLTIALDFSSIQVVRSAMIGAKKVHADATSITPTTGASINQMSSTQAAGTLTINAPTGYAGVGSEFELVLLATNNQTYAFNAIYVGSTSLALPVTLAAGTMDRIKFIYDDANTQWNLTRYLGGF